MNVQYVFSQSHNYNNKAALSVGLSKNEEKPSHQVPKYLIEHGYNIIPVNPTVTEVLGRKCYPSVAAIN
jgi:predicted CoA-binding protein